MTQQSQSPVDGKELMEMFLPQSPFVAKLGVHAELLSDDYARLRLPWDEQNTTLADMVHGGAIAGLADIAVMAAAWSGAPLPKQQRGVTVSMAIDYIAAARATDLIAEGRVLRRGKSLINCEVEIRDADGSIFAKALATYKFG